MGQTYQVSVKAYPAGASNAVNWSTSNSSVATVNGGTITAKSQGTATITATLKANAAISAADAAAAATAAHAFAAMSDPMFRPICIGAKTAC